MASTSRLTVTKKTPTVDGTINQLHFSRKGGGLSRRSMKMMKFANNLFPNKSKKPTNTIGCNKKPVSAMDNKNENENSIDPATTALNHDDDDDDEDYSFDCVFASSLQPYDFLMDNPKYLQRLCLHGDPRHIIKSCRLIEEVAQGQIHAEWNSEMSPTKHQQLLRACRNQILRRTKCDDDMAFSFVSPKSTPLHLLCGRDSPAATGAAVQALLQAADALANHFAKQDQRDDDAVLELEELAKLQNAHGETPLVVACRNGVSHTVIRVLLSHPMGRASVLLCDKGGNSPMMCLANYFESSTKMMIMAASSETNAAKYHPILFGFCYTTATLTSNSSSQDDASSSYGYYRHGNDVDAQRTSIWNNRCSGMSILRCPMHLILEIIQVGWLWQQEQQQQEESAAAATAEAFSTNHPHTSSSTTRTNQLLPIVPHIWRAIASMADVVPSVVVDYMFLVSPPSSNFVKQLIPMALSKRPPPQRQAVLRKQQAYLLHKLIVETPEGRIMTRLEEETTLIPSFLSSTTTTSNLLAQVILAGWTWNEYSYQNLTTDEMEELTASPTTNEDDQSSSISSLLQSIVSVNPRALVSLFEVPADQMEEGHETTATTTTTSLLLPFQLAALPVRQQQDDYLSDLAQVDTIFGLLLEAPEQVFIATTMVSSTTDR